MHGVFLALLVMAVAGGGSAAAVWIVNKGRYLKIRDEDRQGAESAYSVVGMIYGITLGLLVVMVWEGFTAAKASAVDEVTYVSELWRNAESFEPKQRRELHMLLHRYVQTVLAEGWESLADQAEFSPESTDAYEAIWDWYYHYEPRSEPEMAFFSFSIEQLNFMGQARRLRQIHSEV